METKFTPGPWNFYDDSNDGKTNRIEIVAVGKTIARIYHSVPEEDLPNARLIAAAPEMLEALREIIAVAEGKHLRPVMGIDAARRAIAKATGA
jgi:hypothetical protein